MQHALVSFVVPQLDAYGSVMVDLENGGANANSDWMTKTELLATDFDAELAMTDVRLFQYLDPPTYTVRQYYSPTSGSVSARDLLSGIVTPEYWLQGEIASELLIRDFGVNIQTYNPTGYHDQLNVQYYVRSYDGWNGFRVDTVVENVWANARGQVMYDYDLTLGLSSPTTVDSRNDFEHNHDSRWRQTFWLGDQPSNINVAYDVDYMISTGLLPNYDTSLVMDEGRMASEYGQWQGSDHDLMESGIVAPYFGMTGGREEIGLNPTWAVRWLLSMDNRMREITLQCGDVSGYVPIHLRESDPSRPSYQGVISVDDRPTVWISRPNWSNTAAQDKLPTAVGEIDDAYAWKYITPAVWKPDHAHQASFAFIPYWMTGDFYYFEEMNFWGAYNIADTWPGPRQNDQGILYGQTRGMAWGLRNVADAALMAPDVMFAAEKAYYEDKIQNSLDQWALEHIGNTTDYPSIHFWGTNGNDGKPQANMDPYPEVSRFNTPWTEDFMIYVLSHMQNVGWDTQALIDWVGDGRINSFVHDDMNPYRGSIYHQPVQYRETDGSGQAIGPHIPFATWWDVNNGYLDPIGPTSYTSRTANTYECIGLGSLAQLVHLPEGEWAWEWLDNHVLFHADYTKDPTWAVLPKTAIASDYSAPAAIGDLAVVGTDESSVELTWTATGDDGAAGRAAEYDLRYSTSPITEGNWSSATQMAGEWYQQKPQSAGSADGLIVSGLTPGVTYYFAVKVEDNAANWSPLSNVISAAPIDDSVAPAAIADLTAGNPGEDTVDLTWTASGDDGSTGTASSYDIRYASSPITAGNWASATPATQGVPIPQPAGSAESTTLSGLPSGLTLYFAIKAVDNADNSGPVSNSPSATTILDNVAPNATSDLAVTAEMGTEVTLAWTASGDDGGVGTATSYDVRYSTLPITGANWASADQAAGEPAPNPAGSPESFTVTGLNANTQYYFALKAIDNAGNPSGLSNGIGGHTTTVPDVQFALASSSANETAGSIDITVTLSASSSQTIAVDYIVTGGSASQGADYALPGSQLQFSPGQVSQTITVTLTDDTTFEGNETVELTLANPSNVALTTPSVHTLTIVDDDLPQTGTLIDDDFQTDTGDWETTWFYRTDLGGGQWVFKHDGGIAERDSWHPDALPAAADIELDLAMPGTWSAPYYLAVYFQMDKQLLRPHQEQGYSLRYIDDWGSGNDGLQLWEKDGQYGANTKLAEVSVPLDSQPHHLKITSDGAGMIEIYWDNMATPVLSYDDSGSYVGGEDTYLAVKSYHMAAWFDNILVTNNPNVDGDANGDGYVSLVDYTVWAANYDPDGPGTATVGTGDFSGDGYVTLVDYTIWAANYNPPPLPSEPAPSEESLAEPVATATTQTALAEPLLAGTESETADEPPLATGAVAPVISNELAPTSESARPARRRRPQQRLRTRRLRRKDRKSVTWPGLAGDILGQDELVDVLAMAQVASPL